MCPYTSELLWTRAVLLPFAIYRILRDSTGKWSAAAMHYAGIRGAQVYMQVYGFLRETPVRFEIQFSNGALCSEREHIIIIPKYIIGNGIYYWYMRGGPCSTPFSCVL